MATDQIRNRVLGQVQRCMLNLVGGSGHLAAYHLSEDSFQVIDQTDLGDGLTAYKFKGVACYESEFSATRPDMTEGMEEITGRIVLDESFSLARDASGRIRIEPWNCLDPDILDRDRTEGTTQGEIDALLKKLSSSEETK